MDLIAKLPAAPHTLFGDGADGLVLVFADGLAILNNEALDFIVRGPVGGAIRGPDRDLYYTQGDQVLRLDLEKNRQPEDITASFGGTPQGNRRGTCTPNGDIWVEGCSKRRSLNGTFQPVPDHDPATAAPVPIAVDIYANTWSLTTAENGQQIWVLPANAPDAWQVVLLETGRWDYLCRRQRRIHLGCDVSVRAKWMMIGR